MFSTVDFKNFNAEDIFRKWKANLKLEPKIDRIGQWSWNAVQKQPMNTIWKKIINLKRLKKFIFVRRYSSYQPIKNNGSNQANETLQIMNGETEFD